MDLKTFRRHVAADEAEVEILAIDPVIYLLRVNTGQGAATRSSILKNPKGQNWVFRSLTAAKTQLIEWQVRSALLVQQSAYGEMVGSPGAQPDSELRLPLLLRPDD
ncbi:MAG: DUF6482 family protein [Pseudomonadota bacterium]